MGLASFWASLTAPRVKEITHAPNDFWPERGRPINPSAAFRTSRRDFGRRNERPHSPSTNRAPTVNSGEKMRGRLVRSLSRPRRLYANDSKAARSQQHLVGGDADDEIPTVPSIPSLPLHLWDDIAAGMRNSAEYPEDIGRPGTAITTEGLQALNIFELPSEASPPAKTRSTSDAPPLRRRSKSLVPESRPVSSKNLPCFGPSPGWLDKALPPPPPPTCPLPPLPVGQPRVRRPVCRAQSMDHIAATRRSIAIPSSQPRVQSMGCQVQPARFEIHHFIPCRPVPEPTSTAKTSTDSEHSLLDSFPAVPGLIHDYDDASDHSVSNSEAASLLNQPTSPLRERATMNGVVKQTPRPIRISSAQIHKHKDSAIGTPKTPHTPTGCKRWTRHFYAEDDDEGIDMPASPIGTDSEGWNRPRTDSSTMPAYDTIFEDCTNDQALAELEFGTLK